LEFGSCQLKAKYKERKKGRKKERKKEQKLERERERKKEKKSDWVSVFPKLARTILREQSFRLKNWEEKN
jgi:hypothetical protein